MNYINGSVWRRWDFHIHTPYSILNNQFGFNPFEESDESKLEEAFDSYVKELFSRAIESGMAAIGITDYFMIKGYKRLVECYLRKPEKMKSLFPDEEDRKKISQIYVFPNIELRLNTFVGKGVSSINYHVIFSDDVDIQEIEDNFLGALYFCPNAGEKKSVTLANLESYGHQIKENKGDRGSYLRVGLENVAVTDSDILSVLKNNASFSGKYIITIPVDEDLSLIQWDGRNYTTRKNLYQQCHCYMTSNEKTIAWALATGHEEERKREFGSLKPCIWGSDAHKYEEMFNPNDNKNCWIKADPSFEGLLQILYEPEERVAIQDTIPYEKDEHQIIQSIQFEDNKFQPEPIVFNDALNCIIGGKSTGKSVLLEKLGHSIDSTYAEQQVQSLAFKRKTFEINKATVIWKDGTSDRRKIVYIPQTYLNQTIDNPEKSTAINKIVENVLLQDPKLSAKHTAFENVIASIKKQTKSDITEYVSVLEKIRETEEEMKAFGSTEMFSTTIDELEAERKELVKEIDVTQKELERYIELESLIANLTPIKDQEKNELNKIESMHSPKIAIPGWFSCDDEQMISHNFTSDFPTISSNLTESIKEMETIVQSEWTKKKNILIRIVKDKLKETNKELEKNTSEYKNLKVKVDQNKQLQKLSDRITQEMTKLQNANIQNVDYKKLLSQKEELHNRITESQSLYYKAYFSYCDAVKRIVTRGDTELVFEANAVWKQKDFQEGLSNVLDNRKYSTFRGGHNYDLTALKEENYSKGFLETLLEAMTNTQLPGSLALKSSSTMESALLVLFDDWYNIHYVVKSGNDKIEEMSPGKKALVLLELLINLEDSKCPILIDQPEDDLDNRSIYKDLVQFIKRKKKERQIIIVTHNANIVLGADAEEVIIANQDSKNAENYAKRFEYRSGSIENDEIITETDGTTKKGILYSKGIKTQICDILEGGREAFELRQKKYKSS